MVISKKDGEYRVNFKGGKEDTAYYTDSLDDAFDTGFAMARRASVMRGEKEYRPNPSVLVMANPPMKWHMHAGGTSGGGKHGYTAHTSSGEFHISPVTRSDGRFAHYSIMFANTKGAMAGGLWHDVGVARSPNGAKALARRWYDALVRGDLPGTPGYDPSMAGRFRSNSPRRKRREGTADYDFSGSPRAGGTFSKNVLEIRYVHQKDGKRYKHEFGPGVHMIAEHDGGIRIVHPQHRIWEDM